MTLSTNLKAATLRALLRLPPTWFEHLLGAVPSEIDGHRLDGQMRSVLAINNRFFSEDSDPQRARRSFEKDAPLLAPAKAMVDVQEARAEQGSSSGVPLRIYRPQQRGPRPTLVPTVVYFHGGGAVVGSIHSYDRPLRAMCAKTACTIVSVDYRLAPEHPFPAAVDDAMCALRWVFANAETLGVDPERIAVAGDSMGGNLAALAALHANRMGLPPLAAQLLLYPWLDLAGTMPSMQTLAEGYLLTSERLAWFSQHYLQGQDAKSPEASPLYWPALDGLPPAIVITAGFDPLRDEGIAYAKRLREAGVEVYEHCYGSLIHGFFSMTGGVRAAHMAFDDICVRLAAQLQHD